MRENLIDVKIRIKQYPKGWVVEIQKRTWYGRKYWTHLISVSGMEDEAWHYSSFHNALEDLLSSFRWFLVYNVEREQQ